MTRHPQRWLLPLTVAAALVGCGDDGGPAVGTDAGVDSSPDTTPPTVLSTRPEDGEQFVSLSRRVEIRFSEPMDTSAGTIDLKVDTAVVPVAASEWNEEGDVLRVTPAADFPPARRVSVTVHDDFRDRAGNALDEELVFFFETTDAAPPRVTASSPEEGATTVPVETDLLTVSFTEPMSSLVGHAVLEGGPGSIGEAAWSSSTEARFELSGLDHATAYAVRLEGFEDLSGNALDARGSGYLAGNGRIDFVTAEDTEVPTVVDSNPTDGQVDVVIARTPEITVDFSEPMDTGVTTFDLDAGGTSTTVTGSWTPDGTRLIVSVRGELATESMHGLDLGGLTDEAGNALAPDTGLTGGVLGFTTGPADLTTPVVVYSEPPEGGTVSPRTQQLEVFFSEAMDQTLAEVMLEQVGGEAVAVAGEWNPAGTRLALDVSGLLAPSASYRVDLSELADLSGSSIDATHPYLGDGALDFDTGAPTGETCTDPLMPAQAAPDGDALVWTLAPGAFQSAEGNPSCAGPDGSTEPDGVIQYSKTTGDLGGGGTALHVTVTASDPAAPMLVEVYRDVCDREALGGGETARETCLSERASWDFYLDVPAGEYFLWLAPEADGCDPATCSEPDFEGATVRIEEVDAIPEGESCHSPYGVGSAVHSSPSAGVDEFAVPFGATSSVDYAGGTQGDEALSCVTEMGPDAVVELPKDADDTILDVEVRPFPGTAGADDSVDRSGVHAEVLNQCSPDAADALSLYCEGRLGAPGRFQVDGAAGSYYLWLAANNAETEIIRTDVTVREITPGPGETCKTGRSLTTGSPQAITPDVGESFFAPSCLPADASGVTWYRFTATQNMVYVRADAPGTIAITDPATSQELACTADTSTVGVPMQVAPGSDVCVAVESGSGVSSLEVLEIDYQGVGGEATDLELTAPTDDSGDPIDLGDTDWVEVTPTTLYLGVDTSAYYGNGQIVSFPRTVGASGSFFEVPEETAGKAAVTLGEDLYSADDRRSDSRIYQLVDDGTAITSPTALDTSPSYGYDDSDAFTYVPPHDEMVLAMDDYSGPTPVYRVDATTGAVVSSHDVPDVEDCLAIAGTDTHLFLIGQTASGGDDMLFRVPWQDLEDLSAGTITEAEVELLELLPPSFIDFNYSNADVEVDQSTDVLYFRANDPDGVHIVIDASSADPLYAGAIWRGGGSDDGMALDPAIPALYVFEDDSNPDGVVWELR